MKYRQTSSYLKELRRKMWSRRMRRNDQERQWEIRSRQMRRNPVKSPMSSPTWALTQSPHWARQHSTSRTLGPPPPPESIFGGISGTSTGVKFLPRWNCETVWFIVLENKKRHKVFCQKKCGDVNSLTNIRSHTYSHPKDLLTHYCWEHENLRFSNHHDDMAHWKARSTSKLF